MNLQLLFPLLLVIAIGGPLMTTADGRKALEQMSTWSLRVVAHMPAAADANLDVAWLGFQNQSGSNLLACTDDWAYSAMRAKGQPSIGGTSSNHGCTELETFRIVLAGQIMFVPVRLDLRDVSDSTQVRINATIYTRNSSEAVRLETPLEWSGTVREVRAGYGSLFPDRVKQ